MKNTNNMNRTLIHDTDNRDAVLEKNNIDTEIGVSVYFRDIEKMLIEKIREADIILGCTAWVTNYNILDELAKVNNVSLIVQKEDFLRPDSGNRTNFKDILAKKYSSLKFNIDRYHFDTILGSMSMCGDPMIEPVRCVGNHNAEKAPAFPRMHNKFLVFAKNDLKPYAVWTGSFNFTMNATMSLENALYITNKEIVNSYFNEYSQIAAISEPLDWDTPWMQPEWRIGT